MSEVADSAAEGGIRIDGVAIAARVRAGIASAVQELKSKHNVVPALCVVLVGERGDSATYVRMKQQAATECGIECRLERVDAAVSEDELCARVAAICSDAAIHGVIVQLPLPAHIDEKRVLDLVPLSKDIDGFHPTNMGQVAMRNHSPCFAPCTPEGVMILLDECRIPLAGKHAVVLGRSNIVGVPLALMMLKRDAIVTICHSRTANVQAEVERADIVLAAIGKPRFVKGEWIKPGAVVIDVGTNAVPRDAAKPDAGTKLVGDVEYAAARKRASHITPVPGGVGPMTVATLMRHVLVAARRAAGLSDDF
jgi:methylenetetrahydrofolate dehydrogenase (NADP+)/methenyltetrahydrofolate cyclohydrolase/formyltetrahydrofolate synthetase